MHGEMAGGKGYSGGQEGDWMDRLGEDLKEFGIKYTRWREATQQTGRWFRRVEDGVEAFMRKLRDAERGTTAVRCRTVATATPTVDTNARGTHRHACP